ncbi:MAG: TetR family transcriptional regulator [Phenylobacterium sp. RIFCSPHIGHO2_01_FULL_69_31]|uniref:TetR/AcrR family transcriptional regulator n=1 Tax=Phenylobacterium sp. RIFCSPHIGHO2_01_FULL_69_31 TaxID=1801944 RepID=UPI0008CCFFCC|nr:TetR/AcrR family transcriptional regulator [Phenylobacterium sp. RIFCSPHIGHO2_01_FULL_69_31]OHB27736.1 MAG: TetR family transcriptional regulator [Phenylobacterium sp. RIFCSPHIGHO2_01_FULL_69_31]
MPRVLTETDVADFRERLCAAAERLFAEKGPDAVTMRQLASALGVSPMTPYRYFQDKDDILAAVRANGFNRFAEALEAARGSAKSARAKAAAVGEAYVRFAFDHPHTYKLMFDLNQPMDDAYPELVDAGRRAHETQTAWVKDQIEAGEMAGDPEQIGAMFWAATHGVVVLEMAGKLPAGAARDLHHQISATLAKGLKPGA